MNNSEKYISRCIEIAKNGFGYVQPNPMVGSVIVHNNKIIGEGYHKKYGEAHAEVNAINSVQNKELLKKSTIYVSLEPCSHYGKTPPCAELIIQMNIPNVVVGTIDPNNKVAGRGIKMLREAGCNVEVGVLEEECRELNKRFFTYHTKRRPYIILKWAQTSDGFIDIIRNPDQENRPTWITDNVCRALVHKWRAEEQSIIVGKNTAIKDNPSLNVREWDGPNPLRLLIDRNNTTPNNIALKDGSILTIIFTSQDLEKEKNLEFYQIDFTKDITLQILNTLYDFKIQSLIVEGGAMIINSFLKNGLWDEARVFVGQNKFNKGIKAPKIKSEDFTNQIIGNSNLIIYRNIKLD